MPEGRKKQIQNVTGEFDAGDEWKWRETSWVIYQENVVLGNIFFKSDINTPVSVYG